MLGCWKSHDNVQVELFDGSVRFFDGSNNFYTSVTCPSIAVKCASFMYDALLLSKGLQLSPESLRFASNAHAALMGVQCSSSAWFFC